MQTPSFFNDAPTIEMTDPLADFLGAITDGQITYNYVDAVKLAGHSCPTVAGAYLMTKLALAHLYGEEAPVRGNIQVEMSDAVDLEWLQSLCPVKVAVSREQADGHHHGRVTDLVEALPLEEGTQYYLCGLDAMIDDITVWLEDKGVDISRIHRECFFNAGIGG